MLKSNAKIFSIAPPFFFSMCNFLFSNDLPSFFA